jgi:hypothetical protein
MIKSDRLFARKLSRALPRSCRDEIRQIRETEIAPLTKPARHLPSQSLWSDEGERERNVIASFFRGEDAGDGLNLFNEVLKAFPLLDNYSYYSCLDDRLIDHIQIYLRAAISMEEEK